MTEEIKKTKSFSFICQSVSICYILKDIPEGAIVTLKQKDTYSNIIIKNIDSCLDIFLQMLYLQINCITKYILLCKRFLLKCTILKYKKICFLQIFACTTFEWKTLYLYLH